MVNGLQQTGLSLCPRCTAQHYAHNLKPTRRKSRVHRVPPTYLAHQTFSLNVCMNILPGSNSSSGSSLDSEQSTTNNNHKNHDNPSLVGTHTHVRGPLPHNPFPLPFTLLSKLRSTFAPLTRAAWPLSLSVPVISVSSTNSCSRWSARTTDRCRRAADSRPTSALSPPPPPPPPSVPLLLSPLPPSV